jgi:hypothetical protein
MLSTAGKGGSADLERKRPGVNSKPLLSHALRIQHNPCPVCIEPAPATVVGPDSHHLLSSFLAFLVLTSCCLGTTDHVKPTKEPPTTAGVSRRTRGNHAPRLGWRTEVSCPPSSTGYSFRKGFVGRLPAPVSPTTSQTAFLSPIL